MRSVPDSSTRIDLSEEARSVLSDVHDPKTRHRMYSPEREFDTVFGAFEYARDPVFVLGVSSAAAVFEARRRYMDLGYYVPETNRIVVPDDAPCRIAVRIEHLLYSLKDARRWSGANSLLPPLRDPGDSLALSRAINYGVVQHIIIPNDLPLSVLFVRELLARDIIPLVSLGDSFVWESPSQSEKFLEVTL
ncbi:MAG TPA: hypothetical protein PK765_00890 [bacterium]|nr:hypothetical protein [bacterium]